MTDRIWLLCLCLWTRTHWRVFAWTGTRLAPHVTTFPDRPYTRIVPNLMTLGLSQTQIKTAWATNNTYANLDNELREETE